MKTWLKRVTMTAGAMALAAGFAGTTIFAGEGDPATDPADPTTVQSYKDVRLTKTLFAPDPNSATIPDMTFTFNIKDGKFFPYTSTGVATDAQDPADPDSTKVPEVKPATITFTAADLPEAVKGQSTVTKQSEVLVDASQYKTTGLYQYTVTEDQTPLTGLDANQHLVMDAASYTMKVYVTYDDTTTPPTTTVETTITNPGGDKIDPSTTKKTTTTTGDPNIVDNVEHDKAFNFENTYTVTSPDPDAVPGLLVTKKIAGKLADPTKQFDYSILITGNKLTAASYTLIIDRLEGEDETVTVKPDESQTFTLAGGESAKIKEITAGAVVEVKETHADGYVETYDKAFGDDVATAQTGTDVSGTLSDKKNQVDYTNTFDKDVTPTGILINNLPYIALIAVGVAGLGYYFYNKRRHA